MVELGIITCNLWIFQLSRKCFFWKWPKNFFRVMRRQKISKHVSTWEFRIRISRFFSMKKRFVDFSEKLYHRSLLPLFVSLNFFASTWNSTLKMFFVKSLLLEKIVILNMFEKMGSFTFIIRYVTSFLSFYFC